MRHERCQSDIPRYSHLIGRCACGRKQGLLSFAKKGRVEISTRAILRCENASFAGGPDKRRLLKAALNPVKQDRVAIISQIASFSAATCSEA